MEAAARSVRNEPVNCVVATPAWIVLHTATGPEVVGPVHLRRCSNLELLLPDFGTQGIWI